MGYAKLVAQGCDNLKFIEWEEISCVIMQIDIENLKNLR